MTKSACGICEDSCGYAGVVCELSGCLGGTRQRDRGAEEDDDDDRKSHVKETIRLIGGGWSSKSPADCVVSSFYIRQDDGLPSVLGESGVQSVAV